MKFKQLYFFLIAFGMIVSAKELFGQEFLKKIEVSFKNGNAKEISQYFDKYIDITLYDKVNTYNKIQAEFVLQNFFSKIEPKDITNVNKGFSQSNLTLYSIFTLTSNSGNYQIYMFFLIRNNMYLLREIRIEKRQ